MTRILTIQRKKSFVASLRTFQVFINNQKLGELKNGETIQFKIDEGQHLLQVVLGKIGLNESSQAVIHAGTDDIIYITSLKMGMITNKVLLEEYVGNQYVG